MGAIVAREWIKLFQTLDPTRDTAPAPPGVGAWQNTPCPASSNGAMSLGLVGSDCSFGSGGGQSRAATITVASSLVRIMVTRSFRNVRSGKASSMSWRLCAKFMTWSSLFSITWAKRRERRYGPTPEVASSST